MTRLTGTLHTYIHAYTHTYIRTCIHTYIHNTYIHTYTHTHHIHTHTYVRAYMHTYIIHAHTHTHTHIYGYIWDKPLPATEWPHPALRADIMETTDLITYATEIFTDGSKIGDKVGAGVAIFSEKRLVRKCKYRLQNHCLNNQAEQIAILKALEQLLSLPDQNIDLWPYTQIVK